MEEQWNSRTCGLIGEKNETKLGSFKILVFGVGGVGGFVIEALVRAGIENITIVDNDVVSISNLNRQIIALYSTIGMPKVDVMRGRILGINPNVNVMALKQFVTKDNIKDFNLQDYDYVIDAIDNVTAKLAISEECFKNNIKIISCMGTGNKLNPDMFVIDDIFNSSVCPLAKVIRSELKKRNITKLNVLYSKEPPCVKSRTPASISFVPSVAGLKIAGYVIKDLLDIK